MQNNELTSNDNLASIRHSRDNKSLDRKQAIGFIVANILQG